MIEMVRLGPLAFATDRLLALALVLAFLAVLSRIAAREGTDATPVGGIALMAGIVTARLAYVAAHFDAFARDWLSVLAVWQGGFIAWAGLLAAAAVIAWRLRPPRAMRRSLAALALLGGTWFAASAWLEPEPAPLPALPELTHLDGAKLATERLKGRPVVINLWATWCPPCRRELPMLAQAAAETTVPILLVNQGEPAGTVADYLSARGIAPDAVVLDRGSEMSARLESGALPTTLFVDAEGRVVEAHVSEISRAALFAQLAELQAD